MLEAVAHLVMLFCFALVLKSNWLLSVVRENEHPLQAKDGERRVNLLQEYLCPIQINLQSALDLG